MRTKLVIATIVLGCALAVAGAFVIAALLWGWLGFGVTSAAVFLVLFVYVRFVRPWHSRWGATDDEVSRAMPGDDIIPGAAATTRAISIRAASEDVWPWLAQIGYGRAGWYSYDWIDNDGRSSAKEIEPAWQDLRVGDQIAMLPDFGPRVLELVANSYFVAGDGEGGSWCLALYPDAGGSRLVSRWRQSWKSRGLASKFFISVADPGAFLMEQKMLRGIKKRAEASTRPEPNHRYRVHAQRRWPEWPHS